MQGAKEFQWLKTLFTYLSHAHMHTPSLITAWPGLTQPTPGSSLAVGARLTKENLGCTYFHSTMSCRCWPYKQAPNSEQELLSNKGLAETWGHCLGHCITGCSRALAGRSWHRCREQRVCNKPASCLGQVDHFICAKQLNRKSPHLEGNKNSFQRESSTQSIFGHLTPLHAVGLDIVSPTAIRAAQSADLGNVKCPDRIYFKDIIGWVLKNEGSDIYIGVSFVVRFTNAQQKRLDK